MLWKIQSLSCLWTDEGWFSLATRPLTSEILPRSLKKHGYARWLRMARKVMEFLIRIQRILSNNCTALCSKLERLWTAIFFTPDVVPPFRVIACAAILCMLGCASFWRFYGSIGLVTSLCVEVAMTKVDSERDISKAFIGGCIFLWRCLFGPVRSDVGLSSHRSPSISIYKLQ